MDITFHSLQELYDRLRPALRAKKEEMRRNGYNYIEVEDIWNFFKEVKWKNSSNLYLCQMVSDVFNTDSELIDAYLRDKLNLSKRTVYFKED